MKSPGVSRRSDFFFPPFTALTAFALSNVAAVGVAPLQADDRNY